MNTIEQGQTTKYRIVIFGFDRCFIGYWRNFRTGEVQVFESESHAKRIITVWGIDGAVQAIQ